MQKIDVVTYVYGKEFVDLFNQISFPSFVKSFNSKSRQYRLSFKIYTKKEDVLLFNKKGFEENNLKYKFIILEDVLDKLSNKDLILNNMYSHSEIWNNHLQISKSDYVFFLIPDNLYSVEFCDELLEDIENYDAVINYPGYVAKEAFFKEFNQNLVNEKIKKGLIDNSFIQKKFIDYAHPLIWSWSKKSLISNIHHEIQLSKDKDKFFIFNHNEHPIILRPKVVNCIYGESKKTIKTKLIGLSSLSIDTISNQLNMIRYGTFVKNKENLLVDHVIDTCLDYTNSQAIPRTIVFNSNFKKITKNRNKYQKLMLDINKLYSKLGLNNACNFIPQIKILIDRKQTLVIENIINLEKELTVYTNKNQDEDKNYLNKNLYTLRNNSLKSLLKKVIRKIIYLLKVRVPNFYEFLKNLQLILKSKNKFKTTKGFIRRVLAKISKSSRKTRFISDFLLSFFKPRYQEYIEISNQRVKYSLDDALIFYNFLEKKDILIGFKTLDYIKSNAIDKFSKKKIQNFNNNNLNKNLIQTANDKRKYFLEEYI